MSSNMPTIIVLLSFALMLPARAVAQTSDDMPIVVQQLSDRAYLFKAAFLQFSLNLCVCLRLVAFGSQFGRFWPLPFASVCVPFDLLTHKPSQNLPISKTPERRVTLGGLRQRRPPKEPPRLRILRCLRYRSLPETTASSLSKAASSSSIRFLS
jgi:hypothetical protein